MFLLQYISVNNKLDSKEVINFAYRSQIDKNLNG